MQGLRARCSTLDTEASTTSTARSWTALIRARKLVRATRSASIRHPSARPRAHARKKFHTRWGPRSNPTVRSRRAGPARCPSCAWRSVPRTRPSGPSRHRRGRWPGAAPTIRGVCVYVCLLMGSSIVRSTGFLPAVSQGENLYCVQSGSVRNLHA